MLNKHTFKVIVAFLGVIIVGLVSLVIVNSYKDESNNKSSQTANTISDNQKPNIQSK